MLRSFKHLADEPGAPLKPQPANARDAVAWLQPAQVKLHDAQQAVVAAGTRMDGAWFATQHRALMKQGMDGGAPTPRA